MKLIVETTGAFQLHSTAPENFVRAGRPCVVRPSAFIDQHMAGQRARLLGQVNDEATDAELTHYLAEAQGDKDLAIQSFIASFPVDPQAEAAAKAAAAAPPAPKRPRRTR